jgi:hypothetical protein
MPSRLPPNFRAELREWGYNDSNTERQTGWFGKVWHDRELIFSNDQPVFIPSTSVKEVRDGYRGMILELKNGVCYMMYNSSKFKKDDI